MAPCLLHGSLGAAEAEETETEKQRRGEEKKRAVVGPNELAALHGRDDYRHVT